jgi:hypothetical protein
LERIDQEDLATIRGHLAGGYFGRIAMACDGQVGSFLEDPE